MHNTAYTRGLGNLPEPPIEESGPELTARQLAALVTTRERSETLWQDGYEIRTTQKRMIYEVVTPEKIDKKTGEVYRDTYVVDAAAGTCTCPCFQHVGVCKHVLSVLRKVEEALALLTPKAAPEAAPLPFDHSLCSLGDTPCPDCGWLMMRPVKAAPLPPRGSDAYRQRVAADFG